ncbi:MAG: glycine-rich domain-containing protein, partial [Clostridia bacterium]
ESGTTRARSAVLTEGSTLVFVPVSPGDVLTVIVGAGGAGSPGSGTTYIAPPNGATGGTSSVAFDGESPVVSAGGGVGGEPNTSNGTPVSTGGSYSVSSSAEGIEGQAGAGSTETVTGVEVSIATPGGAAGFFGSGGTGAGDESDAAGQNGVGGYVDIVPASQ